jgi:hypothetical protein
MPSSAASGPSLLVLEAEKTFDPRVAAEKGQQIISISESWTVPKSWTLHLEALVGRQENNGNESTN